MQNYQPSFIIYLRLYNLGVLAAPLEVVIKSAKGDLITVELDGYKCQTQLITLARKEQV